MSASSKTQHFSSNLCSFSSHSKLNFTHARLRSFTTLKCVLNPYNSIRTQEFRFVLFLFSLQKNFFFRIEDEDDDDDKDDNKKERKFRIHLPICMLLALIYDASVTKEKEEEEAKE